MPIFDLFFKAIARFFHSDNPVIKVASGLTEPEAEMHRELLADNDITAMVKNMSSLAHHRLPMSNSFDLFVQQSDLERTHEVLKRKS